MFKAYFSADWLTRHLRPDYASQDVQATTICQAIKASVLPIEQLARAIPLL